MAGGLIPGWPLDPDRPATGAAPAPDRPGGPGLAAPRLRALAISAIGASCTLLAAQVLATGLTSRGLWDGLFWSAAAVLVGVRAWLLWRVVATLRTAPGRYAFVIDHQLVDASSGRWWVPALSGTRWSGHWLHLADADTEESLGWVEVSAPAARRIGSELVVAVWGWGPGARHVALSGRFPCVEAIGPVRLLPPGFSAVR